MDIIEEIIAKRPHLEDTLRFYESSIQFADAVKALGMPSRPRLNSYPPEYLGRILERFLSVVDLPEGSLSPLQQALELGEIDFTRLPLLEVPAFSLPYPEDDLTMLLFLFSRPYFLGMHDVVSRDDRFQEEGRCSVCGARPALLSISPEGVLHHHYCSFCGTKGRDDAVGCPVCHNTDTALLSTFFVKKEKGLRVRACDSCKWYVKTVDEKLLGRITPDLADLMSLPLDIMVQEKGYKRPSPNPVGMLRMSASG
jgi:FdhE protein